MVEIKYPRDTERPRNNLWQRILFLLIKFPIIHRWVSRAIRKAYNFPQTVSFNQGFYSQAPLLTVGDNTGLGDLFVVAWAPVNIGKNCSFSFRNMIITSTHDYTDFSVVTARSVTIGDNVWVTSNVTILPGVTIGSNTVIGAGSVVTKDIPSGVFAAGNPCKVIKSIHFKRDEL